MGIQFVLASASQARLKTLRAAGLDPTVLVSGVDESIVEWTDARTVCAALARLKAQAVVDQLREAPRDGQRRLVLGCDSLLEFDGEVRGKPADDADAVALWQRMRGRSGALHTGHCLVDACGDQTVEEVGSTTVTFANIGDEEIAAYAATGEPQRVAGAFALNGRGGWFVEGVSGDVGNVVGLSLPVLRRLLARIGLRPAELWSPDTDLR